MISGHQLVYEGTYNFALMLTAKLFLVQYIHAYTTTVVVDRAIKPVYVSAMCGAVDIAQNCVLFQM